MESSQPGPTQKEIEKVRAHLTKRAETDPSLNVEEKLAKYIAGVTESMDVVWGDVPTISGLAMALDGEEEPSKA
jgi:hypothetical protein